MQRQLPRMVLPLFLCACAYKAAVDSDSSSPDGATLAGELIAARGLDRPSSAVISLFDAFDPPPPLGLGVARDLSALPESAWSHHGGVESAPFSLDGIASGDWLLQAIVDVDEDYDPFYDFTTGATCGDLVGAFVAGAGTTIPATIEVEAPALIEGLPILLGAPLESERPVFTLSSSLSFPQPASLEEDKASPVIFLLDSVGVSHPLLTIDSPNDPAASCPASFSLHLVDQDLDAQIDAHPDSTLASRGLLDIWPRVYLVYYRDPLGEAPSEGETWVMPVEVLDEPLLKAGRLAGERFSARSLALRVLPLALHHLEDGSQEWVEAPDLPVGAWAIVVHLENGQSWTVPNQLGDPTIAADFGLEADESQAAVVGILAPALGVE